MVDPTATLTILFIVLNLFESTPTRVEVLLTLLNEDCKLTVLSFPADWAVSLNLNVPIPAVVVPKPTTLDLNVAVLIPVFSKSIDKTPELKLDVNVPMKLFEKLSNDPESA